MNLNNSLLLLATGLFILTSANALFISDISIDPSNQIYSDDTFSVDVTLKGSTCRAKIRLYLDNKPFNSSILYNGTKYLKCNMYDINSGDWDLKEKPLFPGNHAIKIELYEPGDNRPYETKSTIVRILDLKRDTTTTTRRTTTTRKQTTTTTTSTISTTTSTTLPVGSLSYSDVEYEFGFEYPGNWKIKQKSPGYVNLAIPFETGLKIPDIFQENITISVVESSPGMSIEDFTQLNLNSLGTLPGFKLISSEETQLSGEGGWMIFYDFKDSIDMRAIRKYVKVQNRFYVVSYVAESSSYFKYLAEVDKVSASLSIFPKSTTTTTKPVVSTSASTTSTTRVDSSSDSGGFSLLMVGGVIGFILILVFVLLVFRKKSKPHSETKEKKSTGYVEALPPVPLSENSVSVTEKAELSKPETEEDAGLRRLRELEKELEKMK